MSTTDSIMTHGWKRPFVTLLALVGQISWIVACILTLGYGKESHEKMMAWKSSIHEKIGTENQVSAIQPDPKDSEAGGLIAKKQRKEYDRLTMPLSVITATSAAALAIPSPFGDSGAKIHWLATAFYSGAFGLSLGGIFILMYLNAFISDLTKEADLVITSPSFEGKAKPFAIILVLPTTITTYSSAFLFIGLVVMTIAADQKGNIEQHMVLFKMIVLVPAFLPLLCLATAIVACNMFKRKVSKIGNAIGSVIGQAIALPGGWIKDLTEHLNQSRSRRGTRDDNEPKNRRAQAGISNVLTEEPQTGV